MQGARSFVSSRMFGKDERSVPNIVAIYAKPRHKVRRDATHVFGGMYGWNKPEETERALRAEDARAEEAATTTPTTSLPVSDVVADSTLSGLAQQSGKRPTKRSRRRALVPLTDMGASILSSHLQELMRRQQGIEEPEEQPPLPPPAKRPSADVDDTPAVAEPVSGKKARISATSADPPVTKKLRLTISTAPPASATPLQLPLSPPDTSSNASKAPADEHPGPISSTPKASLSRPDFPEFDLTNLSGTFSLSPIDSDSESESSSESSSSSSSDSPDLSSSTSTRSTPKDKGRPQSEEKEGRKNTASNGRNNTPSAPASSTRGPSTPPKKKRPTHRPGWIGWVQTEESPDHSRLIRLDDAPVILGRRTRSGKEFQEPLPPPVRKRPAPSAEKPKTDQPPRQNKPRPRPPKASRRTGQKSKQQSAWQEAQRRANGESGSGSEGRGDGEQTAEPPVGDGELPAASADASVPGEDVANSQTGLENVASSTLGSSASPSPSPIKLSPSRSLLPALRDPAPSGSVMEPAPASPVAVLKLTRSDAVITPTGARPNEEKDGIKKSSSFFRFTASPTKDPTHTNTLASPDNKRSGIKDAQSKSDDATARPESKSMNGTSSASTLASNSKSTPASTRSSDKAVNRATLDRTSPEKGGPMSELSENSPTFSMATGGKSKEEKLESVTRYSAALAPFTSKSVRTMLSKTSASGDTTAGSSASSKAVKPFPMFAHSRSDSKAETSSKASAKPSFLALGKRKESSGQSSSQVRLKKRKLLWSSSDESETPKFIVNPFDRRAKQMELTRKGLSGDAFQVEMKKWMDSKKAEWKLKEREKAKDKEKDKEVAGGSNEVRVATGESSASKPKSETVRTLGSFGIRPKGTDAQPRKRVWNVDWGMEFAKVSVAPHTINGDKNRSVKMKERMDPEGERDRRNSDVGTRESHAGKDRRESDAADRPYSALAKSKSRV